MVVVRQVALKIFGMVGGPILGLFCLGMFFPWANSVGALVGLAGGLSLSFWVGVGSILTRTSGPSGPRSLVSDCRSGLVPNNSTVAVVSTVALRASGLSRFYSLSYMWYSGFTCFCVVALGLTVSLLTGPMREQDVAPGTVFPLLGKLLFFLPEDIKQKLCCVTPLEPTHKESNGLCAPQPSALTSPSSSSEEEEEESRSFLPEPQTNLTEHETSV